MKLTEHFTLEEMTRTKVKGIDNTPDGKAVDNLKRLCRWLEMLRGEYNKRYGTPPDLPEGTTPPNLPEGEEPCSPPSEGLGEVPIIINSGYRSEAVNRAVGGAATSNHLTGCAADIRCLGVEQALRYATILLDISDEADEPFDELLIEKNGYNYWVHFAVRPQGNRRKILFITTK